MRSNFWGFVAFERRSGIRKGDLSKLCLVLPVRVIIGALLVLLQSWNVLIGGLSWYGWSNVPMARLASCEIGGARVCVFVLQIVDFPTC